MARALWNNVLLAESEATKVVEGNHYFPPDSIRRQYFRESDTHDERKPSRPAREQLKAALKAFKKRLRVTVLEEESKLSRRPTTSGRGSAVVAITPPDQYPQAVWEELVRQGKLRKAVQAVGQ